MSGRVCSVPGCYRKHNAKGLCSAHGHRVRVHGDVLADKAIGWRSEIIHGTYDGYANHRCRCEACTKANTDYYRERRHALGIHRPVSEVRAERRAAAEARDNHGTETRYSLGCRCRECRDAVAAARRRRRAGQKVAA